MSLFRCVWQEIFFRRWSFLAGVLIIALAAGGVASELIHLDSYSQTQELSGPKGNRDQGEDATARGRLPKNHSQARIQCPDSAQGGYPADLYDPQSTARFMPEDYAQKLARNRVVTINHVLPSLTMPVQWPEQQKRLVILMGSPAEVWVQSASQKPLQETVASGQMVVGYELGQDLHLDPKQKVLFMGRTFTISKVLAPRGTWDDRTVWVDLHKRNSC